MLNLSRFDLVSLRIYVAAVEAGSLTAGAERFGISLAAASKRIAELERDVETSLLERSKKGVVTTPAGQTLYRHALRLIADLEQLAVAMGDYRRGVEAHVRLWANTSAVNGFLPAKIAAFLAEHPATRVDLEEALSVAIVRAVESGAADLGVFDEHTPAAALTSVACDSDRLVLLMPRGHPLAAKRQRAFAAALDYDFIGLDRSASLMRALTAAAAEIDKPLNIRVQVRSFDAMCRLIAAGVGIGVLPQAAAAPHVASMRLAVAALEDRWAQRRLLLGYRSLEALSPPARALAARLGATK